MSKHRPIRITPASDEGLIGKGAVCRRFVVLWLVAAAGGSAEGDSNSARKTLGWPLCGDGNGRARQKSHQ